MDHQAIREQLLAMHDAELSEVERSEIVRHLDRCAECRQIASRWTSTRKALASALRTGDSEAFVGRVMRGIEPSTSATAAREPSGLRRLVGRWRLPGWLMPELGVGLAALLFVLVVPQSPAASVSTEAILLAEVPEESRWVYAAEAPHVGAVLEVGLEEI